jgi:hypothetical protein
VISNCPEKASTCEKCKRRGHFTRNCSWAKRTAANHDNEEFIDDDDLEEQVREVRDEIKNRSPNLSEQQVEKITRDVLNEFHGTPKLQTVGEVSGEAAAGKPATADAKPKAGEQSLLGSNVTLCRKNATDSSLNEGILDDEALTRLAKEATQAYGKESSVAQVNKVKNGLEKQVPSVTGVAKVVNRSQNNAALQETPVGHNGLKRTAYSSSEEKSPADDEKIISNKAAKKKAKAASAQQGAQGASNPTNQNKPGQSRSNHGKQNQNPAKRT